MSPYAPQVINLSLGASDDGNNRLAPGKERAQWQSIKA